jgi:methionyl-tRNA formyltransferase
MIRHTSLKTIFFGSSDYSLRLVDSLINNFQLAAVVTKPDLPVGRQKIPTPTPVKQKAVSEKIPAFTPHNKAELLSLQLQLRQFNADIFIVADYGLIIPEIILNLPRLKTINIHFSKLPKLRGPSPVQYTILLGEKKACITFMLMDKKMDTGDILMQKEFPLAGDETAGDLYTKLFNNAVSELPSIINKYAKNELKAAKQNAENATYTKLLTRNDGYVPWHFLNECIVEEKRVTRVGVNLFKKIERLPCNEVTGAGPENKIQTGFSEENYLSKLDNSSPFYLVIAHAPSLAVGIHRLLRAFTPWPGLWTEIEISQSTNQQIVTNLQIKKRLKIIKAHLDQTTDYRLQTTESPSLSAKTGKQQKVNNKLQATKLIIDLVQLEGKNPVTWKQFCEGYPQLIQSSLPPHS